MIYWKPKKNRDEVRFQHSGVIATSNYNLSDSAFGRFTITASIADASPRPFPILVLPGRTFPSPSKGGPRGGFLDRGRDRRRAEAVREGRSERGAREALPGRKLPLCAHNNCAQDGDLRFFSSRTEDTECPETPPSCVSQSNVFVFDPHPPPRSCVSLSDDNYSLDVRCPKAEKISPNDLAVFDDEVAPNQWSRRAHTLERIADRVPVTNRFPAYAEYTDDDRHRHLFQVN